MTVTHMSKVACSRDKVQFFQCTAMSFFMILKVDICTDEEANKSPQIVQPIGPGMTRLRQDT